MNIRQVSWPKSLFAAFAGVSLLFPVSSAAAPIPEVHSIESSLAASARALRVGDERSATEHLRDASARANRSRDPRDLIDVQIARGLMQSWAGNFSDAEHELRKALQSAEARPDQHGVAAILNNLGNICFAQGRLQEARDHFIAAIHSAKRNNNSLVHAQATANRAQLAVIERDGSTAENELRTLIAELGQWTATWDHAILRLHAAQILLQLARSNFQCESSMAQAELAIASAQDIARAMHDPRMSSIAFGVEAQWFEEKGLLQQALKSTHYALWQARQCDTADLIVDWEWQSARLWRKLRQLEPAIAAYHRAVSALQSVRHDFSRAPGNSLFPRAFHAPGEIYVEFTDLLLQTADEASPHFRERLMAARHTMETQTKAELDDYFRDECVNLGRSKIVRAHTLGDGVAVIYPIALSNRLELLIHRSNDLARVRVPVTHSNLVQTVATLRYCLEKRTTFQFRRPAQQLYRWLIDPIRPHLDDHRVDTLIWIAVEGLRSIPISALHNGQKYLIEEFAVGVTPGLDLIDPKPFLRRRRSALAAGLTQETPHSEALDHVVSELNVVRKYFRGTLLTDHRFRLDEFADELHRGNYSLVHIASHASFDANSQNSFIEAYHGRFDLDDLEKLIRPSQYRGAPIELLVLSACQTAGGSDRAALGLAGIAVKSGARSALASLWNVNDEATALLISTFYQELQEGVVKSKAHALRAAQRSFISNPAFQHPFYWSPFILIGNWL